MLIPKNKNEDSSSSRTSSGRFSVISLIEEDTANLTNNFIVEENMVDHIRETKTSYEKSAMRDEIIGFLFVLACNFTRAVNGMLMKYIEKTYSKYFETIPFLLIRAIMIMSLSLSFSFIWKQPILKPREIKFKIPFLIRTNFNFFAVSLFTVSIWYLRVSTVQIISALNPIFVTYLSVIILKEKFYVRYVFGIILCILGSLLIINNEKKDKNEIKVEGSEDTSTAVISGFSPGTIKGMLCSFGSTLINCAVDICNKVLAKNKIPITTQLFYLGFFTFSYAICYVLFTWRLKLSLGYILLSFLQGTLFFCANATFNFGIQRIDLSKAAPVSYTKVVFVLLLGGVLLGERVYFTDFVGAAMIISYMLYNLKYPIIKKD